MKQIIKLSDIYSADLYTRSKATELALHIQENADIIELDFSDIAFMSRSFADEVCNIIEKFADRQFVYTNRNEVVETMMTKVAESRKHERVRMGSIPQMLEFTTMESLEKFLMANIM